MIADSSPGPNGEARPFYDFLESCLRHKGELVRGRAGALSHTWVPFRLGGVGFGSGPGGVQ